MTTSPDDLAVLVAGPTIDEREERLAAGADGLLARRPSLLGDRNVLVIASGALVTTGLSAIVLGWIGAAHSTIIEEQVPYLISGGLLGLALAFVGALAFFAHWLTVLVRESRAQEAARARDHAELLDALRSLRAPVEQEEIDGDARSPRRGRPLRRAPSRS